MKIPASVLETSFSEVLATVKSVPTPVAVSVAPKITPTVSTPSSPNGLNIKPQHILIGIAVAGFAYLIYKWIEKKNEDQRKERSY